MILPKKTKINYKNRTLKKKKFKNKFYKVTKRNNLRISKKKGGAPPGKVNYLIRENFYDCSGNGNEVKINKLSKEPTPKPTILETLDVKDYNEGDFIQYGNIFLFCKELKKDNVIFEIYNKIPDNKNAKFIVEKKPIEGEGEAGNRNNTEDGGGPKPEAATGTNEGHGEDGEDGEDGGDGPEPGPITTYYYDKLKLPKSKPPLLNANMEKVLSKLDNYNPKVSEVDRKIEIKTQNLNTTTIVEKQMLPEEYLKNLVFNHGYEIGNRTTAIQEIISYFYNEGTKKNVADAIKQLKKKAELELEKPQNK